MWEYTEEITFQLVWFHVLVGCPCAVQTGLPIESSKNKLLLGGHKAKLPRSQFVQLTYRRSRRLGTLSIDDGNDNGDGETEERLRRGRGCVAKLEAVKQAQYDDNFPRLRIKYDVFVKRSQKSILIMK